MSSTDPTTVAGVSAAADLLVWIPRQRSRTIRRVCIFGFSMVVSFAAGLFLLDELVRHTGMSAAQRVLFLGLAVLFCLNALGKVVLIWFSLKLPLEISKSGMNSSGQEDRVGVGRGLPLGPVLARYPRGAYASGTALFPDSPESACRGRGGAAQGREVAVLIGGGCVVV